MPRSFAWSFGWRLALSLLFAAVLWRWLRLPWEQLLSGLLLAAAAAASLVRALQNALLPLAQQARAIAATEAEPTVPLAETESAPQREFAALQAALREAHLRVQQREWTSVAEQRKLESILDSLPEAIAALDSAGRLQWINASMQKLLPEAVQKRELQTHMGQALVHIVRDPDVLQAAAMALNGESVVTRRARTILSGQVFEVNAAPMPQNGAVVVLRDVTRAERMERTQRDFVANVSHELRTPLTSITGYVETMLEDLEPVPNATGHANDLPVHAEFLGTVLRNAERMNLLIDDLLELSRVESGEHRVQPVPTSAAALVEEALLAAEGFLPEHGHARVERGDVQAACVMADPDATLRVLTNLLENALKYGRGPVETHVVVSASLMSSPSPTQPAGVEMLRFSVRDAGPGIASEHQSRLFERFYRVDKARSRETGGTGLGLAIARGLVSAQGGELWCESELGHGSDFRFTLPLASEEELPLASEDQEQGDLP